MKLKILSALLLLTLIALPLLGRADAEKVLYEGDSLYHHIRVSEVDGYRYLSFNRMRGSQSAVNVENPYELKFAYTKAAFVVPAMMEEPPKSILFIGLGGGSIPRVMAKHYPDAKIDVVEIDRGVVDAAKKYFFFKPTSNMKIHVMDGRNFMRRTRDKYDLIFLDAYDDRSIPFHLTTREFFEIVKRKLNPGGIMASNVWGPRSDEFFLSEVKTYQQVFKHVYLIDSLYSSNYIIIADVNNEAVTTTRLMERIPAFQQKFQFEFQLESFARSFEDYSSKTVNADALTDDFAPVEILRGKKAGSQ